MVSAVAADTDGAPDAGNTPNTSNAVIAIEQIPFLILTGCFLVIHMSSYCISFKEALELLPASNVIRSPSRLPDQCDIPKMGFFLFTPPHSFVHFRVISSSLNKSDNSNQIISIYENAFE
jgi:hypothetical protein